MRKLNSGWSILLGCALLATAGCGVDIEMNGPANVAGGQTAQLGITVRNISACPLVDKGSGGDFLLLPFLPQQAVNSSEIEMFCQPRGGAHGAFTVSTSLASQSESAIGDMRAKAMAMAASGAAAPTTCTGPGVLCAPFDSDPISGSLCELPEIAPGNFTTLNCSATVPNGVGGPVYSVSFVDLVADGVCKLGTNQSQACDSDSDCGGTMGACGNGICQGGSNDGNGCDVVGDCPSGTCVLCDETLGLGFACLESAAAVSAPAPAVGPWVLTAAVILLSGIGAFRLRRRTR